MDKVTLAVELTSVMLSKVAFVTFTAVSFKESVIFIGILSVKLSAVIFYAESEVF